MHTSIKDPTDSTNKHFQKSRRIQEEHTKSVLFLYPKNELSEKEGRKQPWNKCNQEGERPL